MMKSNHTFSTVRGKIQEGLAKTGVASLALGVARQGEIVWESGFGWADREQRRPATAHTLYSLASISKPISATGLMVLVQRGLLDLDRPVNDYLGTTGVTAKLGAVGDATVRRIANHTSGLPVHCQFFYEDEPFRPPYRDESIRRYGNLVGPPGEAYQYANLGYGILDHLISRLSGKPYKDFMRESVFIPLDMPHTSVDLLPGHEGQTAVRYGPDGMPLPWYDFDHPGASAVWSSAHDLVRFGMMHLKAHLPDQTAILEDATIDATQEPTAEVSPGSGYGIGWRIDGDNFGYRTVGHDGSMGGVRTRLLLVPSEGIAVAVLTNGQSELPARIISEVLSVLLPEYGRSYRSKVETEASDGRPSKEDPFRPVEILLGVWEGYVETYRNRTPLRIECQSDGDIHVRLGKGLETLLNEPRFKDGRLTGRTMGQIDTEDAMRHPHHLIVNLKLRGDRLTGVVTSSGTPKGRSGNALSHWTELAKG